MVSDLWTHPATLIVSQLDCNMWKSLQQVHMAQRLIAFSDLRCCEKTLTVCFKSTPLHAEKISPWAQNLKFTAFVLIIYSYKTIIHVATLKAFLINGKNKTLLPLKVKVTAGYWNYSYYSSTVQCELNPTEMIHSSGNPVGETRIPQSKANSRK